MIDLVTPGSLRRSDFGTQGKVRQPQLSLPLKSRRYGERIRVFPQIESDTAQNDLGFPLILTEVAPQDYIHHCNTADLRNSHGRTPPTILDFQ